MTQSFSDFNNQLLALRETLKVKKEIANVAGDGAVSMPPTAKKVKRKSKTFNVSPQLFDVFRRGKKKFERWSKYLNMEDEGHRALYSMGSKIHKAFSLYKTHNLVKLEQSDTIVWVVVNGTNISRGLKEDKVADRVEKDAEKFVKDLKPKKADFVKRYGKDAERVMYAL